MFTRLQAKLRDLRSFSCAEDGVSAVEFALVLPIMVALYLGGVELTHGVTIDRKVTAMTSAAADLVSQAAKIENAEMDGIFDAAAAILQPYSENNSKLIISSVRVDSNGAATIVWSDAHNTSAHGVGSSVTLPEGITENNTTIIMAEGRYTYTPQFGTAFTGDLVLTDTFYLRPRMTNSIQRVP